MTEVKQGAHEPTQKKPERQTDRPTAATQPKSNQDEADLKGLGLHSSFQDPSTLDGKLRWD